MVLALHFSWTWGATAHTSARPVGAPTSGGALKGEARATHGGIADEKGARVVLVDRNLPDSALLARAVSPGGRVFLYDSTHESAAGVLSRVVTWAEAAGVGVASLSVLSHGVPGAFELGDEWITTTSAGLTPEVWRGLKGVLTPKARIYVFGCNVAAPGRDGPRLLDELARLTGADVFASDNATGRGGDWELEVSSSGAAHDAAASVPPPLDVAMLESSNVSLAWYDPAWLYRRQVTIDHTKVSGGVALTAFPMLLSLTSDANLAAHAQASGDDILFTSADGTTKLSHEIEGYTSATGALIAWVKVPILSATVDTVLYIYYGNASASIQQNSTAVWDAHYHGVWHLKENGALASDSTSNANNATTGTLPIQTSGKIGEGQSFDGSSQFVGIPDSASLDIATDGTFSVWFKLDELRQSDLFEKGGFGGYAAWQVNADLWWGPQNGLVAQWSVASGAVTTGRWYRLDGVSSAGIQRLYLDGALAAQSTQIASFLNAGTLQFGKGFDGFFMGSLDEMRISDVVRSNGWIVTEYNNQFLPGTFTALGADQELTSLGNGTDPGNASLAPGGATTMVDAFTFQTATGADAITALTVTLTAGTSGGLGLLEITNDAGTVAYGSVSNPVSDTPAIGLTTSIAATTTVTQYKIRMTPRSHAAMPAPLGSTYSVTAFVSDWTGTNVHAGSDSGGTTVTIDNQSPGNVTGGIATPGSGQVSLSWANPLDSDLGSLVVLRSTSAVADVPAEGVSYVPGNTIGFSTVACVLTALAASCIDSGLTNDTGYHYEIFARDLNGNYATGVVPAGSPATPRGTTFFFKKREIEYP
jgi:Domain of unknown function (DUF4347)/Concanavalin A-like lectin/glucanases superfamily/Domain of unknown function (DUF2341)